MAENSEPSFKSKVRGVVKDTLHQLDKALDVGVQSAVVGIFNTPPEMSVDWRSMLRVGGKLIKDVGRETAAALFSKKG
jgi:hypothetical protein